jgi:hypothetical protein
MSSACAYSQRAFSWSYGLETPCVSQGPLDDSDFKHKRLFLSLDYLYVPTRDIEASVTAALGFQKTGATDHNHYSLMLC